MRFIKIIPLIWMVSVHAEVLDRILAIVGDQPVLLSDLKKLSKDIKTSPYVLDAFRLKKDPTEENLIQALIERALIRQTLKDNKNEITEAELNKQIQNIAAQHHITFKQLRDSLQRDNIDFENYKNNIRFQIERRTIFENEIRNSSSASISDPELKAEFQKKVQLEWNLLILVEKNSPQAENKIRKLAELVNNQQLSIEDLQKQEHLDSLGWVNASSLQSRFREALKGKQEKEAVGPILVNNTLHLLIIEKTRKGSEEQFQAMKDELVMEHQKQQVDELFQAWVDRKKLETELVINK